MSAPVWQLECVEAHAEGKPGRIVINAGGLVSGETMRERFQYCVDYLDPLRRAILHEPRGYPGLCAVLILPPVNSDSAFGIVVLDQGGFTPTSGSNSICAITALLEAGIVPITGPETELRIDTAVGTFKAVAHVHDKKVTSVTVQNVPSFVHALDVPLRLGGGFGEVPADIVFGGRFFAHVRATDLGLELTPERARELGRAGALVKLAALEQVTVQHPLYPAEDRVDLVMIHSGDPLPGRPPANAVVLTTGPVSEADPATWTGVLDRSPCGTGTSGRMAALHARGQLAIGEPFVHRGILGTEFTGRLEGETDVAGRRAVLPTITGRAWQTGRTRWTLDSSDPFRAGFTMGDIWGPEAS
jgi:proline racemase